MTFFSNILPQAAMKHAKTYIKKYNIYIIDINLFKLK